MHNHRQRRSGLGFSDSYTCSVVMLGDSSESEDEDEFQVIQTERRIIFLGDDSELEEEEDPLVEESGVLNNEVSGSSARGEEDVSQEAEPAPPELEDGVQATIDELTEINLGTEDEPRPTFISASLTEEERENYKALLYRNRDIFAWSYKEMPGLDVDVAVHRLSINPTYRPVKQAHRRFHPDLESRIVEEVDKLIAAGFIKEVRYPTWVANIVPVKKKNGQIRVCVDFRDLNKACPKDDFPLPITEMMIDAITEYKVFSFMDGSSGYNQIKMAPEDAIHTAFRTPKGIYCYNVMPFGLKNAGATYQRAMTVIFNDLLHEVVECYVDDLVVKTKNKIDHLNDLQIVFDRLRRHNLKMNPLKCAFGVSSGKFLGFVVRYRGIEIDPLKIKAIQDLRPPSDLTELKSLQGRLAYIRRFISNLSGRCHPFSHLMKKNAKFEWGRECQNAFESIKKYLMNPPVLAAPEKGKPLILYIAALDHSLGGLLAQKNEEGKEVATYYISRTLVGAEHNYSSIEKICLALIFAVKKLRHYLLAHKIQLISRADPLKYLMTRPTLSGRLAKWALMLLEFDIEYVPQKAIKGQALADFLAAHAVPDDSPLVNDLPGEEIFMIEETSPHWEMYFDGASQRAPQDKYGLTKIKAGAGVVFLTPNKGVIYHSLSLLKDECSNNEAEYEALIIGLSIALEMKILFIYVFGDSQLVVRQLNGIYEVRKTELIPYYQKAKELISQFAFIKLVHIPRSCNSQANALAQLAAAITLPDDGNIEVVVEERLVLPPVLQALPHVESVNKVDASKSQEEDWRVPFIECLKYGRMPEDRNKSIELKRRIMSYTLLQDTLYKRSYDQLLLRCLSPQEARQAMDEIHSGICGAHQAGPKMRLKLKQMGYYWPTMLRDCIDFARKCHICQIHGDFIHQPPVPLHPTVPSWPFAAWGTDIVGPIDPPSSCGHRFILAATDYFTRWAEAIPLKEVKADNVVRFMEVNIIYRFGVPNRIISDNGTAFKSHKVTKFAEKYHIDWRYSSIYNPRANGLAEAFNKTLCKILKKTVAKNKRDWHDRIPQALWAYRTTFRTPTQMTPYSLVFGGEAVLPLEVEIPSLRVAVHEKLTNDQQAKLRLQELETLEEERLTAQQNLEIYRIQMARAYDKAVRYRAFQEGDLVLVLRRPIVVTHKTGGKFEAKWEGPYVVEKAYEGGAYQLVDHDGKRPMPPINGRFLKKYYFLKKRGVGRAIYQWYG
jgi:ribonuclease HI/transposase InsO family protein